MFAGCRIVEEFSVPLARRQELILLVCGWYLRHDAMRLLYVPTRLLFWCSTGIYKNCRDVKRSIQMIKRTEKTLMTIGGFFAACRNDNSSDLFGHVLFDHHRGSVPIPFSTDVLEDVKVLSPV